MTIEKYFGDPKMRMRWFEEGSSSRYSLRHWNEMARQAFRAREILYQLKTNTIIGVIGFGFGRETEILLNEGFRAKIMGLDINPGRFSRARELRPHIFTENLQGVAASMNHLPLPDNALDTTICLETMMHADNPAATLRELTRVTKPDGFIIFNISVSKGKIKNFLTMLEIEGLKRMALRALENLRNTDKASKRTKLLLPKEFEVLISGNPGTILEEKGVYLRGLSAFVVLKKLPEVSPIGIPT